ncbi:HEAT repeat domain-containing protein [Rubellicoccus peritrichatus]|uniref:HEAT repeat domain-containing protein n=1 Tax=Rubellicoccus peritrichatus TaxID=3080537 RepID=A0AAQ3L9J1_9BACT|nr:HEAT repeat domain-containing protein [Puniceicoccus sp. CR14]WOO39343.1 HEAT repeat domain-containing protein [Puniceicoccus sp. CR14]
MKAGKMKVKPHQHKNTVSRLLIFGGPLLAFFVFVLVILFFPQEKNQGPEFDESSEQAQHYEKVIKPTAGEVRSPVLKSEDRAESISLGKFEGDIVARPTIAQVQTFEQKLAAIRALGYTLSPEEIDAVFDLLNTSYRPELGVTAMQWDSLKNEALNQLTKQVEFPEDIYEQLAAVWSNRQLSDPSREYAVQFYVLFLERAIREKSFTEDDLQFISTTLTNSKLQGTALLGLGHLVDDFPGLLESVELNQAAREVISGRTSPRVRSAAIQTLIRIGDASELTQIADIAVNSRDTVERLSAIAALGELGGDNEIQTIIQIQNSDAPLFANAAQVARNKIFSRLDANQAF